MQSDDYNFILYIFHATILYSQRTKTNLLHNSYIFNMFRSDLLAIFRELYAVMFQLKVSHVVTTVVVCTIINY